jgi:hypothetical protein
MPAALRAELVELLAAALVADLAADRLRAQSPGIVPVLERLWALEAQGPDADLPEGESLLQEHARLTDELGPAFAEAVWRQWCRDNANRIGSCRSCGAWATSHDLDHEGRPCPLAPDAGASEPHAG